MMTLFFGSKTRIRSGLQSHPKAHAFRRGVVYFGKAARSMSAELYLLAPGAYTWSLVNKAPDDERRTSATGVLSVRSRRTRVRFEIPPRELCFLNVRRR